MRTAVAAHTCNVRHPPQWSSRRKGGISQRLLGNHANLLLLPSSLRAVSAPVLFFIFLFSALDALTSWGLDDPGETASPRAVSFLEIVNNLPGSLSPTGKPASPSQPLKRLLPQPPQVKHVQLPYSEPTEIIQLFKLPLLNLLTQSHPFFPLETTIKALAHSCPLLLLNNSGAPPHPPPPWLGLAPPLGICQ